MSFDLPDIFAAAGLVAITTGVGMLAGAAVALVAAGVILLAIGLTAAWRRNS